MIRRSASITAAILLVGAVGCSRNQPPATAADHVVLVFANESLDRAEVLATSGDIKARRIGVVGAGEIATLQLPREFTGQTPVSFFARKSGGADLEAATAPYTMRSGEPVRLRLQRNGRLVALTN